MFLNFEKLLLGWLSLRAPSQDDALRRADLPELNGSPFLGLWSLLSFYFLRFPSSRKTHETVLIKALAHRSSANDGF